MNQTKTKLLSRIVLTAALPLAVLAGAGGMTSGANVSISIDNNGNKA